MIERLLQLPGWGHRTSQGSYYSIKYRVSIHAHAGVNLLKGRYPEMMIHFTTNGHIIFGGTFNQMSQFFYDAERLVRNHKKPKL